MGTLERILAAALRGGPDSPAAVALARVLEELERMRGDGEDGKPLLPEPLEVAIERAALWR